MAALPNEPDDRVRELLRVGERLGYLTYEELNAKLPDEVVSPVRLDAILIEMDRRGIRLIDEADIPIE
jgi:RNA polymerase primary sigma factor